MHVFGRAGTILKPCVGPRFHDMRLGQQEGAAEGLSHLARTPGLNDSFRKFSELQQLVTEPSENLCREVLITSSNRELDGLVKVPTTEVGLADVITHPPCQMRELSGGTHEVTPDRVIKAASTNQW